jgi:stage II sporulation protein D (peptidoglycan lytic transglycosylase)
MTRLRLGILLCLGGVATQAVEIAQTTVRVRLFSIEQPSEVRIVTPDVQTVSLNAKSLTSPFRSAGPVMIERKNLPPVRLQFPVEVSASKGTLVIVTELPLETYVAAVLAGESSSFRSDESLKAMAVAARTYAVHFLGRHKSEGFDFCDTTHCQDFRITALSDRLLKSVAATESEVIVYNEAPIPAYYHQDCGGIPEPKAPYLRQLQDSFCVARGRLHWSAALMASDLRAALSLNQVTRIEVTERSASGRVERLRLTGSEVRVMDAETFRLGIGRAIGWNKLRSDLYDVRREGDRFIFEGYGSGHGIGLCQNGAAAMGEQGFRYKEILAYYYPNTRIARRDSAALRDAARGPGRL